MNMPTLGMTYVAGVRESTICASMDFETYSEAGFVVDPVNKTVTKLPGATKGGLPAVGTPVYAEHPTTDVICLYYDLKDGHGVRGWIPNLSPLPADLIDYVQRGGMIEAWNFTFEFWIWNLVCVRKYGFPPLPLNQGVCVMARSRRYSLPGSLAVATKALGVATKQEDGKALIRKLTRPHKPTKARPTFRWTPQQAPNDFMDFFGYCAQDVVAEDAAAEHIPDLTPSERHTWLVDQTINVRGVHVDRESLDACLALYNSAERALTMELSQITQGAVGSVGETAKLLAFLQDRDIHMPDMKSETVEETLERLNEAGCCGDHVDRDGFRALQIRQSLAGANIKKLFAIDRMLSSDNRLRDQYMYCGADRTGRWSAGGAQLQNMTAKGPKTRECKDCSAHFGEMSISYLHYSACPMCGSANTVKLAEWTVDSVERALADIRYHRDNYLAILQSWGDPTTLITGCLRGLFMAAPGKKYICCDFSAIEAVVAACLSGCQWRIDVFSTHGKIYEMSASKITGTPMEVYEAYKAEHGMHHPDRKKIGKIAELASGYGGWIGAWKNFGAGDVMTDQEIKENVLRWRDESPEIVEMWGGQFVHCGPGKWDYRPQLFGLEGMAIAAISNPGERYQYRDITYFVEADILHCVLPSGRMLHYHRPQLVADVDKLNRGPCVKITFEGYNSNPQKGPVGWCRMETYGGRLFENVVQAVAADIQAEALKRLEDRQYPVVMHTHDEAISEVDVNFGSVDEMAAIMSERPPWASWWPIKAAGWTHTRYQKD